MEDEFRKDDLLFYLPESFKGLSKEYIMNCIFDESIQKAWIPTVGDVIVGPTGNIFVISAYHHLHGTLGGNLFFFGGGLCNRDGGIIMNETYSSTMNESGKWYGYNNEGKVVEKPNSYHSSFKDFRFVPYPHELKNYKTSVTWN